MKKTIKVSILNIKNREDKKMKNYLQLSGEMFTNLQTTHGGKF